MSRIVAFGEIMARLATPGFKRFQQTLPGTLEVIPIAASFYASQAG